MEQKERILTFPFLFVGLITLLVNGLTTVQLTAIPLFVTELGGSTFLAGFSLTAFTAMSLLFKSTSGRVVGRNGLRWPLIVGYGICTIAMIATGLASALVAVFALRMIFGASLTFASTSIGKAAADNVPRTRLMEGMGYIGLISGLVASAGSAISLSASRHFGYRAVLLGSAALMAITVVLCLVWMRERFVNLAKDALDESPRRGGAARTVSIWRERAALPYALTHLLAMMAGMATVTFLPAFCLSRGIENIGLMFVVSAITGVVVRLTAGRLADRHGPDVVLIPSFALMAVYFVVVRTVTNVHQVYALGALAGAAGGMLIPILQGLLVANCPGRSGNASALYYGALDAGFGLGGLVLGAISAAVGYEAAFLMCAVLEGAALATYLVASHYRGRVAALEGAAP